MQMSEKKKVFVLGVDGLDARLLRKYVAEGVMPNFSRYLSLGAANENLEMIGGHPTVTPPMWTTLATGATPYTHGVTDFFKKGERVGICAYNFDSRHCAAEPLWNVTAEAGLKTLVWHWPGSSWPPTANNDHLMVVDGTQPEGINMGNAVVDNEKILLASAQNSDILYRPKASADSDIPCYITGMEFDEDPLYDKLASFVSTDTLEGVMIEREPATFSETPFDIAYSPIQEAQGWLNAPKDAKECTLLHASGLIRRPALILKDADGLYRQLAIYKDKKSPEPIAVLTYGIYAQDIIDEALDKNGQRIMAHRNMRLIDMAEDGSSLKLWISAALDFHNDTLWHPKKLLPEVISHAGYPQPICVTGGHDETLIADCMRASWDVGAQWNARAITYLMEAYDLDVVFSHFHNVDLQGHMLVPFLKNGSKLPPETVQRLYKEVMLQTDRYVGQFLPLIDKGWTIFIVSDHGQSCPEEHLSFMHTYPKINGLTMVDLGYTVLEKDDAGKSLAKVNWSQTKAVSWRMGEIWINLKGRDPEGIVEPADKYALEEQIMTDLYSLKDPETGHRVVYLALRNKDAVLLGMGGPNAGDILYFNAEPYVYDHADSLSTIDGACDTSDRAVFIAAGPGICQNVLTKRIVHHMDLVPTIASLLKVRLPRECEGAPVYQILSE